MLPVCRALGAASPLPARCSGCLFALFQKSKPRKLATGCERQDSRSMRSSMKVRAASSSAGFGDSPAVSVVWGPEAGRAAAHGEGQHLRHPAAPRGLGSDPDRGAELGGGGLWDGGSPSQLCCCGWRGEQPSSPAPRRGAPQQANSQHSSKQPGLGSWRLDLAWGCLQGPQHALPVTALHPAGMSRKSPSCRWAWLCIA